MLKTCVECLRAKRHASIKEVKSLIRQRIAQARSAPKADNICCPPPGAMPPPFFNRPPSPPAIPIGFLPPPPCVPPRPPLVNRPPPSPRKPIPRDKDLMARLKELQNQNKVEPPPQPELIQVFREPEPAERQQQSQQPQPVPPPPPPPMNHPSETSPEFKNPLKVCAPPSHVQTWTHLFYNRPIPR